jgi:ABC-type glycerol-3-phosphate transport system substrate-binding protein
VDALIPSFEAAAAAKQGPDIALVWPGIWGLPYVWKGDILPLDDYLPADVLSHDPELIANSYGGKRYFLTWWWDANLLAYNKELFAKAGLDPEKPPVAWDKFLDACEKLKGIGVTPMVLGFKDLWDAEVLYTPMIYQNCDTPAQVLDVSCGNVSFTDPKFLEMWDRTAELNAKGYFNADILSLETYSADEPFVMGKAAMRPRAITSNVVSWAQQMGKDKVGTMQFPTFGKGKLVTKGVGAWWPETLCIPSFAAHPREAADFLAFFYTKERVNALHKQTGTVPGALDLFDASLVENPEVKKVIDWGYFTHYELLLNSTVDLEGVCKSLSDLVSGTVTPLEAAKFVDGVMARWKEQKPDEYKHVLEWGKDIARLG